MHRPFRIGYFLVFMFISYLLVTNKMTIFFAEWAIIDFSNYGKGFFLGVFVSEIMIFIDEYVIKQKKLEINGISIVIDKWAILALLFLLGVYVDFSPFFDQGTKMFVQGISHAVLFHYILLQLLLRMFPKLDGDFRNIYEKSLTEYKQHNYLDEFIPFLICGFSLLVTAYVLYYWQQTLLHDLLLMVMVVLGVFLGSIIIFSLIFNSFYNRKKSGLTKYVFKFA